MTPLRIDNRTARHLWLSAQGLSTPPIGAAPTRKIIQQLGYVQLDTIRAVERAHHHILWSRDQSYRPKTLDKLLGKDRHIFEHFCHDACVLPVESYPLWQRQMQRFKAKLERAGYMRTMPDAKGRAAIKARIAQEGPLSTHAFDTKVEGPKEMWARPPHKLALDFMWYTGELATCHRDKFKKVYDLTERVIPEEYRAEAYSDSEMLDWLCRDALDKMSIATRGQIQRFYAASDSKEVAGWLETADYVPVEVQTATGDYIPSLAAPDIEVRIATLTPPTKRLRILNPFDPATRDRDRLEQLFGFNYRIEMFVPATKRLWGYYVFPILQGDQFIGRIEAKANRKTGALEVIGFWTEPKPKWSAKRTEQLDAELARFARFADLISVIWHTNRP